MLVFNLWWVALAGQEKEKGRNSGAGKAVLVRISSGHMAAKLQRVVGYDYFKPSPPRKVHL